jgi:hypothetical protein
MEVYFIMENNEMMRPARFPDTWYFGIRPMICMTVAEMDDMSVVYPTQGMQEAMVDRVYNQVVQMYPDEFQSQDLPMEHNPIINPGYHAEQFFPPFRRRRPVLRDLLGVLILLELLDRRRHR